MRALAVCALRIQNQSVNDIATGFALHVLPPINGGAGQITQFIALKIDDPGAGAVAGYALVSDGGHVIFNAGHGSYVWYVYSVSYAGIISVDGGADALAFFGSAPVTKPVVAGSKGGNAALASLMTALSSLGLVTDTTT